MPVTPNPTNPDPGTAVVDPLLTEAEYISLLGIDTLEPEESAQVDSWIPAVSRTIRLYTGRKFESTGLPSARTFQYDYDPYLATDDFTDIVSVEMDTGIGGYTYALQPSEYVALPYRETTDDEPHNFVLLLSPPRGHSPEMGFTRNEDTILRAYQSPILVTITATWGWPSVPEDVKAAAALIIKSVIDNPGPYMSESIEGYSRSQRVQVGDVLPDRAKTLLSSYIQMNV